MASVVRVRNGTFTTDTSTFDITAGGGETRNPTGCIVLSSLVSTLSSNTNHISQSFGVTDFTTVAAISPNYQNARVTNADGHCTHQETTIINITNVGDATVIRSATVAAIAGGVRFTPVQSGTAYKIIVILVFGAACKAFSDDGDGAMAINETFTVAHGLGVKPNCGIYFMSDNYLEDTAEPVFSTGFHVDTGSIVQNCHAFKSRTSVSTTSDYGVVLTTRVASVIANAGNEEYGYELTGNDATNCTYTNRTGANTTAGLIGLLIDFDDVTPFTEVVPTPTTAASDWNYNALSFTSQFAMGAMNQITTVGTYDTSGLAGTYGIFAFDESGAEHMISARIEDAIVLGNPTPTTAASMRQDVKLYLNDDTQSVVFDLTNLTFTADGFDVASADITTMDSTIRRWPMLFIESGGGGGGGGIAPLAFHHLTKNIG